MLYETFCFPECLDYKIIWFYWIGHRKEIRKPKFRALALRRSESRNCGLCVVYTQKDGTTLLVGAWWCEKQQNKFVKWKVLIPWGLRVPIWKRNFRSRVLRLSVLPWFRERPQTAIYIKLWVNQFTLTELEISFVAKTLSFLHCFFIVFVFRYSLIFVWLRPWIFAYFSCQERQTISAFIVFRNCLKSDRNAKPFVCLNVDMSFVLYLFRCSLRLCPFARNRCQFHYYSLKDFNSRSHGFFNFWWTETTQCF